MRLRLQSLSVHLASQPLDVCFESVACTSSSQAFETGEREKA